MVLAEVNAFAAKPSLFPYSRKIEIRVLDDYSAIIAGLKS